LEIVKLKKSIWHEINLVDRYAREGGDETEQKSVTSCALPAPGPKSPHRKVDKQRRRDNAFSPLGFNLNATFVFMEELIHWQAK
jgi:hypothetical protein